MKIAFVILITLHALIHFLGFSKAFNLAELGQMHQAVSKLSGLLWLLAGVMILISMLLLVFSSPYWWWVAIPALFISQALIFQSWSDAKFGSIANVILLFPIVMAMFQSLPSSYTNLYKKELGKYFSPAQSVELLNEKDMEHLPVPVRNYLRFVGAVGKPKVQNFRVVMEGEMKLGPDRSWSRIQSEQFNFLESPARIFYIQSQLFGLPFEGLHLFQEGEATMQIKAASMVELVNARGQKMDQSETVTFFNDMCLFAPATLINKNIRWKSLSEYKVLAGFNLNNHFIEAELHFNKQGQMINFISNDRFSSADGKVYESFPWETPIKNYIFKDERNIPEYAEAIWKKPSENYVYAKFKVKQIHYNVAVNLP